LSADTRPKGEATGAPTQAPAVAAPASAHQSGDAQGRPSSPGIEAARRVRSRLPRLGSRGSAPAELEPLLKAIRALQPKADLRPVHRAYALAERSHDGQYRRSGDPYITHPLAVATILAELPAPVSTIVAALLHDTVEDTSVTIAEIRKEFGETVAGIVDGVTKLDRVKYGEVAQAETIRKMVVAMARDPKVLVVKLGDRLHNLRTLAYLPADKQQRIARETLEIYAPLAHRLGMNAIKWELEDRSFETLYPKRFEEIGRLVADRAPSRETYLGEVIDTLQQELHSAKIKAVVTGRPKHFYSIYQKMIVRGRDFGDIYDLIGIRVLVDSVRDCYAALGVIHALWSPVPGRFKDYIARPKFNLYQSLHTTVMGPQGKPVELQIRSNGMHERAEIGIAAHWRYKDETPAKNGDGGDIAWLRQLLDWQRETTDPTEFLDALRFDLLLDEVFVFTPRGDVIALPHDATPVDFAYAVHTEVGHRCIGARVNGRLVPLESTLDNGDVVEVFTAKTTATGPSRDWLGFVKSPRARNKIRQWFARERRDDAIERGKESISREMRRRRLPLQRLLGGDALATLARELHHSDISALYAAVGEGHSSAQGVIDRLVRAMGGLQGATEDIAEAAVPTRRPAPSRPTGDSGVRVPGVSDVWVRLARCCTPVPGDDILGFVTHGRGVSVHRADCTHAADLQAQPERLVTVQWSPSAGSVFLVAVQVDALDRNRLLADITEVLSDAHVNILSASLSTGRDRVAVSKFSFEMGDVKHLGHLLASVRKVEGVYDAYRVPSAA
jgi:GTP pyrophosphokinase